MEYIVDPQQIERKSMAIIADLITIEKIPQERQGVVKRIVHTTGDPEYASLVQFHPKAVEAAMNALRNSAIIYTDVNMVLTGINKKNLRTLNCNVFCAIDNEDVLKKSLASGETRAMTAMQYFGKKIQNNIVAIGNAPTALFQILKMVDQGIKPALIVGTPVGFVGAKESKELLCTYDIPYITVTGFKGGSAVAAAVINGLMIQVLRGKE